MSAQRPGFGPAPSAWIGFVGGPFFLWLAYGAYQASSMVWAVLLVLLGLGSCWSGINDLRTKQIEDQALRFGPRSSQRELTTVVLSWLGVTDQDLGANRQGTLTASQWATIQGELPPALKITAVSPVRWVEGPIKLLERGKGPNEVKVGGISFHAPRSGFLDCFKRTASYRMYYVEISYSVAWSSMSYNRLVAAEALGDA
jgi:hypothetical protein